mmetsp:Transcript_34028/g.105071  ORF Transcript_34028/g.105071 Transcript_34028/m.105071 type:complete len:235 (-) Transcript_34028:900-1604(-)
MLHDLLVQQNEGQVRRRQCLVEHVRGQRLAASEVARGHGGDVLGLTLEQFLRAPTRHAGKRQGRAVVRGAQTAQDRSAARAGEQRARVLQHAVLIPQLLMHLPDAAALDVMRPPLRAQVRAGHLTVAVVAADAEGALAPCVGRLLRVRDAEHTLLAHRAAGANLGEQAHAVGLLPRVGHFEKGNVAPRRGEEAGRDLRVLQRDAEVSHAFDEHLGEIGEWLGLEQVDARLEHAV